MKNYKVVILLLLSISVFMSVTSLSFFLGKKEGYNEGERDALLDKSPHMAVRVHSYDENKFSDTIIIVKK